MKRKTKWILSILAILWLFLAACGYTGSEWRSACCRTVEFPYITGTCAGPGNNQYLIVCYEVPIDHRAGNSLFKESCHEMMYVSIPFEKQQVPDRFRYDGPRKSAELLEPCISKERISELGNYRFETSDWILGDRLSSSSAFCPANKDAAKVFSSNYIKDAWLDEVSVIPYWTKFPFKGTAKKPQGYFDFNNNKPRDLLSDSENLTPDYSLMLLPTEQPRPWRYQFKAIAIALVKTPVDLVLDITVTPLSIAFFAFYRMAGNVWW